MKKKVFWILIFLYIIILVKFYISNYNITYNIDDYKIVEKGTKDYIYIEVTYQDKTYNYMFNTGRKLFKKRVKNIEKEEIDNQICLKPKLKGLESYYMCSSNEELISYQTLKNIDKYENITDNFKYYKNLKEDEHIYIWKYDGFYYLNDDEYKSINIFNKDRYSNDLMIEINGYIIFPYYDSNYLFNDLVSLDMTTGEYEIIESDYQISYDSYIVGNRKNNIYLFDNKEQVLYEINYKKGNIELIGNSKKGYIKYVDGKKEDADVLEYTKDKITYFEKEEDYIKVDGNYFNYSINKDIKIKYFLYNDIEIVNKYQDSIYFIYKDKLYRYEKSEAYPVAHYFELNFNKNNNIFIYNE